MRRSATIPIIRICVQSSELAVRTALTELLDHLAPLEMDMDELGTVELVLAEALNNVVEHAYPENDAAGPIDIQCEHAFDGLHLKVTDHGRAMPGDTLPAGDSVDVKVSFADLPEGGFGWSLIKDLAKDLRYERVDRENRLMFRVPVATRVSAA